MKVLITGSSGYLAGCLIPLLEQDNKVKEIIGLDIAEPKISYKKFKFIKGSILEPEDLTKNFKGIDCVVHMAFNINGMHDKTKLDLINVQGSRNVMKAVADAGVKKLVFTSSIAAYGAFKDNPVPLKETDPLRGKDTFFYSDQKQRLEEDLDEFQKKHKDINVVRLRLCTTTGPKSNNETITLYTAPVFVVFPFHQPPVQLLHEDDAGKAFHLAVVKNVSGPFNLGSDWKYTAKEHAKMAGTKIFIYLPVWVSRFFANLLWTLRLIKFDPSWITASLYPVVVDCSKAEKELGWKPEYDSEAIINSIKGKR